jgi:PKD repeat protein
MNRRILYILLILGLALPSAAEKRQGVDYGEYGKSKGAFRGKYWHYYERGASFAEGGFWEEAAEDFEQAAKKRKKDERGARTYGMRYIQYYPHRELGVSYFNLGRYEDAKRELELSHAQVPTGKAEYFLERTLKAMATVGNDMSPPRITILSPEPSLVSTARTLDLVATIEDDRFVDSVRVAGETYPLAGEQKIEISQRIKLKRGTNWIRIDAKDASGNTTSDSVRVEVDLSGPTVTILEPSSVEPVSESTIGVLGRVEDPNGVESFSIANAPVALQSDGSFETTVELIVGENAIGFEATDKLGNPSGGKLYVFRTDPAPVVLEPLSAKIRTSTAEGPAPLTIVFFGSASSSDVALSWDFGDPEAGPANRASGPVLTRTFDRFGEFTVRLTATDGLGRVGEANRAIRVLPVLPQVALESDVTDGTIPLEVVFSAPVTPAPGLRGKVTHTWDFGDGSSDPSQNPVHTYESAGTYPVTVTVEGPGGTVSADATITVREQPPTGTFSVTPGSGFAPHTAALTAIPAVGSGPIDRYLWTFGDGQTGEGLSVSHTYKQEGQFAVSLTMEGPGGDTSIVSQSAVEVVRPGDIAASFSMNPETGISPLEITFTDASTGQGDLTYRWDFGDPSSGAANESNEASPGHVYSSPGTYVATLTLIDTLTRTATGQQSFQIRAPVPLVSVNTDKSEGVAPLTAQFTTEVRPAGVDLGTLSYHWEIDGDSTATGETLEHTFETPGEYRIGIHLAGPVQV